LFGPVFAAAVILSSEKTIRGLRDSKELDLERREDLAERIRGEAVAWAVAFADAAEIDRINIYQASRLAMKRAVETLSPPADFVLVDAMSLEILVPQRAVIKGDAKCRSIAAASILAKVHRDWCMLEWDHVYPQYDLCHSKGYATMKHLKALEAFGPTPLHRFTFEPVRQYQQLTLALTSEGESGDAAKAAKNGI
jgi:ribonuclease HII